MKIDLYLCNNTFKAVASINLENNSKTEFSFHLNRTLEIEEIICNQKRFHQFNICETNLSFRPSSNLITIYNDSAIKNIAIHYSGTVDTWYNTITTKIISLNWYSVWYPQDTSIPVTNEEVLIYGCSDYIILKSRYNSDTKVWLYDNQNYDPFNIMAYKKKSLYIVSNPHINIYYCNKILEDITSTAVYYYEDIVKYYNGVLFNKTSIPVINMILFVW